MWNLESHPGHVESETLHRSKLCLPLGILNRGTYIPVMCQGYTSGN